MVYLYIYHKHQPNVGKYIIHMDGMGNRLNNTMFSFFGDSRPPMGYFGSQFTTAWVRF